MSNNTSVKQNAFAALALACGVANSIKVAYDLMLIHRDGKVAFNHGSSYIEQINNIDQSFIPMEINRWTIELAEAIKEINGLIVTGIIGVKTPNRAVSPMFESKNQVAICSFGSQDCAFAVSHLMTTAIPLNDNVVPCLMPSTPFSIYNGERDGAVFSLILRID